MNCECDFEKAEFGKDIYCKNCGMDVGLDPIRIHTKRREDIYCCEGCIE